MSEHMLWETIDEQKRKIADLEQDLEHKKIAIRSRNAKIKELEKQIEKMKCCENCGKEFTKECAWWKRAEENRQINTCKDWEKKEND